MIHLPLLMIGTTELLLIGGLALLLFGGKKLPELMRGLGKGMQSFKKGMHEPLDENPEHGEEENDAAQQEEKPSTATEQGNVNPADEEGQKQ